MSEEINLNTNNLCTTEDVFEKFQATSMYEEDEFITLSDIVPPEQQPPDLTVDLNDIPYENEVVLESQLEEQVPEVNSTIDIGSEDNKVEACSSIPDESICEGNSVFAEKSKPKRGRRKRTQHSESILTVNQTHNEQSNDKQDVLALDGIQTKSTSSILNRRGRKPKRNRLNLVIRSKTNGRASVVDTKKVNDSSEPVPEPLSSAAPQSNSASESENASVGRFIKRKPGRPKKPNVIDEGISEEKKKEVVDTKINVIETRDPHLSDSSLTLNDNKTLPKRGRRKQEFADTSSYEILEKKSNIELNLDQSQSEEIENPSLAHQVDRDTKSTKSPKKRKRSKKSHSDAYFKDLDKKNVTNALSNEDDDFADDICLSKLKKTLEPTDKCSINNSEIQSTSTVEVVSDDIVTTETSLIMTTETPTSEDKTEVETISEMNTNSIQDDKETSTHNLGVSNEVDVQLLQSSISKEQDMNIFTESKEDVNDSLLIEDTSKRPTRRKARKTFHYDDGSDEDPFANVELSDDEPRKSKKGKKYYSDDEYVPGMSKRGKISSSDLSDSDIDEEVDELMMKQRRKKQRLDMDKSPKKRGRKSKSEKDTNQDKTSLEVKTIIPDAGCTQDDDIEICLQSSVIKTDDVSKQKLGWGASNEFESFIAKKIQGTEIKIKKASSVQPLEIPVINTNDTKKTVQTGMQTTQVTTSSVEVQTSVPYDVPMKDNVPLTSEQAANACEFLKGIVKTTAELGELMTQKSEDFIKKKINTSHVTDTFKMDYCVRKSFLLFKLAKHNLMQMEEDLSKQYDDFLSKNDLMKHREEPKVLTAVNKSKDEDSDCEIIDAPPTIIQKPKKDSVKPKFSPKTVFLNKELSIKIAKKPSEEKKLQIKGRHTVWISDSVMVKKVKPTQSFLAQDSRNKKPPDYITIEMVNNFFKEYDRHQLVLLTCAPFVTNEWMSYNREYVCSYFFTKPDEFTTSSVPEIPSSSELNTSTDTKLNNLKNMGSQQSNNQYTKYNPKSLFSICTQVLQSCLNESPYPPCAPCDEIVCLNGNTASNIPGPKTLSCICVTYLQCIFKESNYEEQQILKNLNHINVFPLQTLCLQKVTEAMNRHYTEPQVKITTPIPQCLQDEWVNKDPFQDVKSLYSLCVLFIQQKLNIANNFKSSRIDKFLTQRIEYTPCSLKTITYKVVTKLMGCNNIKTKKLNCVKKVKLLSDLCFEKVTKYFEDNQKQTGKECLTINSINRLTEEAYLNLEETANLTDDMEYYADEDTNFYEDNAEENTFNEYDVFNNTEESNWISQVEMKELRSIPNKIIEINKPTPEKNGLPVSEEAPITTIKIEPVEETEQIVDSSIVKTEPMHNLDEMTIIPESVMTNSIEPENIFSSDQVHRKRSSSYDVDSFEAFVRSNKLMYALNEQDSEIFSQSASRIRRQYEPDSDTENDMEMSLLVPQTFEPLLIENAKDRLMESSGDENSTKKTVGKKKTDRRKTKAKKIEATKFVKQISTEKTITKEIPKEKQPAINEIAVLTRRMREKIRQEEKKIASSDSETENSVIVSNKDKEGGNSLKKKAKESVKENSKTKQKLNKSVDDEIQCNNVDSTEQVSEKNKCDSPDLNTPSFTGFSAVDQNEVFNYQKYVKYVYDKILSSESNEYKLERKENVFSPGEPVELLQCEPTISVFDTENTMKTAELFSNEEFAIEARKTVSETDNQLPYKMRHGWKCYQLDANDTKLYLAAQIVLEKLPETFVDTYFMYQNVSTRDKEDEEVDRLTNLQSLNRSIAKEVKGKSRNIRRKSQDQSVKITSEENQTDSRIASPANSEHFDELTPSEDEVDDQIRTTAKQENSSENTMAKSSLMNDNDTDEETGVKIKKEIPDEEAQEATCFKVAKKSRPGPKSKCKLDEPVDSESMMLTADKMMNRELNLLHAPIVPNEEPPKTPVKGPITRNRQKNFTKSASGSKLIKVEDGGSSSEEEKNQWFTIKEKLLKKMLNKKDTTREDDAKRAKLVNEFIERRGDLTESYLKRRSKGNRSRRSTKKMLERQKQFKVLSRELFGDVSNDASHQGKGRNSSHFKGRRNIRKVIDKKSLAESTVLANMEEFERKRRLNIRQNKLREILGFEEGVNVLVINDEVCLEYDFESGQPVVTIHPFFTKVMKAHQYEGVKFMWDACFESLENIEAGHPGGGCILAHCMGLGKTLQVLALLHTVLTHPRVGMQRVLVCCPLSTVLNWVDEIHKWIGPVTDQIKVFELSKLRKTYERAYQLEDWYKGGGIFIIGYELFRSLTTMDPYLDDVRPVIVNKIRNALLDPGPDIIICDEGHLLKNDCSVLAVAMSRVRTSRRIILTGTPMQNNLREYYCMVNFVKPNLLGTYAEYSNRFENPIMNGQHRDSREEDIKLMKARTHILHKVLEGCLQRQEASVLYPYLPKKHEYTVFVSLSKCQWDLYKHYLQNCTSTQSNKNNVLKDFHILQKIWSHPQVLHNFQSRVRDDKSKVKIEKLEDDLAREDLNAEDIKPSETDTWWLQYLDGGGMLDSLHSSNKFMCVFRILDECIALGDKLLIFSTSLFTMDALEYFLKKIKSWSLGKEYFRLDGSVPAEVRQKWCREFNAEHNVDTKLFLISTRAGCLGLNMTAANRVIILDTSWNPAHDIQSIFRVYRFGQKKDCYIYRLVALGTMEQKIYERSVTKQAVACRVVDEQQIDRHYNSADLTELYRYDEAGVGVAGGVAVGVEDVVLLRVARDTNLHAVHEHDSLLRGSGEQGLPEHERNAAWMQFQQEHANKQMQENITSQPSQSNIIKQVHGHDYAKVSDSISTIKTEKRDDTSALATKSERKRGTKKGSVVSCNIPIEPQPAVNTNLSIDQDREEELVSKITHILIKHNFHVRQEPNEIAALVSKVRNIVASGRLDAISETDELSSSIAKLLIQNDLPAPQLTNIVCESVNNTLVEPTASSSKEEPKQRVKGKRKGKKPTYIYEEIKPSESAKEVTVEYDGRKKRRAALAAEKSFDAITDCVVYAADESDSEFVPNANVRMQLENQRIEKRERTESLERFENSTQDGTAKEEPNGDTPAKRDTCKRAKIDSVAQNKRHDISETQLSNEHSILLSDDDELPLIKKPGPARMTLKFKAQPKDPKPKTPEPDESNVNENSEEVIPLHPSLLSNQNFIKIVAHTYLTGNPMLDEDAATLAAQYSTQKALKEFESTGKKIESGPLYEIAVKVLGIDILKKLHYTKGAAAVKSIDPAIPTIKNSQEKVEEISPEPTKPAAPKLKAIKLKIRLPVEGSRQTPVVTSSTLKPVVVPASSLKPIVISSSLKPGVVSTPAPCVAVSTLSQATPSAITSAEEALPSSPIMISPPLTPMKQSRMHQLPPVSSANVVPVGLFLGAAEMPSNSHQSTDECILPDDDDIRIISDPIIPEQLGRQLPPVSVAPATRSTTKITRRSVQLVCPNVQPEEIVPKSVEVNGPLTEKPFEIKLHELPSTKKLTTRSDLYANTSASKPISDPNTICLDSDDEDFLPSVIVSNTMNVGTTPVPVSLTAANSLLRPSTAANSLLRPSTAANSLLRPSTDLSTRPREVAVPIPTTLSRPPANHNALSDSSKNLKYVMTHSPKIKLAKRQEDLGAMPSAVTNKAQLTRTTSNETVSQNVDDEAESILPVSTSECEMPNRMSCKAGDILRISRSGKIEVLNRRDELFDELIKNTNDSSKSNTAAPITIDLVDTPVVPKEVMTTRNKKSIELDAGRKDTTNVRAKSNSPFDPLSILRDVVRIEADHYVTQKSTSSTKEATKETTVKNVPGPGTKKELSTAKAGNTWFVARKEKTTPAPQDKSTENCTTAIIFSKEKGAPISQNKSTKSNTQSIIDNFKSTAIKVPISSANPTIQKTVTKTVVNIRKPNEKILEKTTNSKKPKENITESIDMTIIDITSNDNDTSTSINNAESKLNASSTITGNSKAKLKLNTGSTITGSSKDIILCGAGIAIKRPQAPPVIQALEKKRATTTTETGAVSAKKKKTDKPMTLKDFDIDIDDIDDIIELD